MLVRELRSGKANASPVDHQGSRKKLRADARLVLLRSERCCCIGRHHLICRHEPTLFLAQFSDKLSKSRRADFPWQAYRRRRLERTAAAIIGGPTVWKLIRVSDAER